MSFGDSFQTYLRIAQEPSFATAQDVASGWPNWNSGPNGRWLDLVPPADSGAWMTPTQAKIFDTIADGRRAMNSTPPVAGRNTVPGTFSQFVYPELTDRILLGLTGVPTRTPTAGTAAATGDTFPSTDNALSAQPTSTEQIVFTIASSTNASGASIDVKVGGTVVETIPIQDSVASVDGVYRTQGGYEATVTFDLVGTVTGGTVDTTGISYTTSVFKPDDTVTSFVMEQHGFAASGALTNSEFYNGAIFSSGVFTMDNTAEDNAFQVDSTLASRWDTTDTITATVPNYRQTATGYGDMASQFFRFFAGWTLNLSKGGVPFACKLASATVTINTGAVLIPAGSGNQDACAASPGPYEVLATFGVYASDATEWNDFTGDTEANYVLTATSPFFVNGTTPYSLSFDFHRAYIETMADTVADTKILTTPDMRMIYDPTGSPTNDVLTITKVDRMSA